MVGAAGRRRDPPSGWAAPLPGVIRLRMREPDGPRTLPRRSGWRCRVSPRIRSSASWHCSSRRCTRGTTPSLVRFSSGVSATAKRNPEQAHRVGRLKGGQDVVDWSCRLPVGLSCASSVPQTCLKRGRNTVSSGPSRIIARSTESQPDLRFSGPLLVEVMGFEPTTSSMRPKRPEWSARAVTWDFASCAARHLGGRALRVPLSGRALRPKGGHRRAAGPTDPQRHDRRRRGRARRARS